MLCDPVVEEHMAWPSRRSCHALGKPRILVGHHVRTARPGEPRRAHRLDQESEPLRLHVDVGVGIRHDLAGRVGKTHIASGTQPSVLHLDEPGRRVPFRNDRGLIARPVV